MRFEAAAVLQQDILSQSYASENQRRIAVLRNILTKFNDDFAQVTADSRVLSGSNMMIRQTLNGILNQLDASPALAANLDDLAGMEFDQMNLDKGRVRMLIEGDIVKLKIKIGSSVKDFEEDPDVLGM